MTGKDTIHVAASDPTARATLTSLPKDVLERIIKLLHVTDKGHLALCCKATLPIMCMGHVRVITDNLSNERRLHQATRCLTKQPGDVSHLEVTWWGIYHNRKDWVGTRRLIDLSLLPNLRTLTLHGVYVSLPALQPVATRLHDLFLSSSRLYGSADGFLTKGWTALTSLCLNHTQLENATVTAALQLPALEDVMICRFTGHRGGELQLDQLTGSCPQVSRREFQLGASLAQATETSRQSCRLLNLTRLADLHVTNCPDLQVLPLSLTQDLPLDLPSSLTQLKFGGSVIGGSYSVNFFWALQVAVKCVRRGAQLHKLICNCVEQSLQPAEWGASLDVQHRRLGGQLGSLRELEVWGAQKQVLNAVGAIASAAPSLARLVLVLAPRVISGVLAPRVEVSPICSASLESIRVEWQVDRRLEPPPSLVLLTFLPGCTRLQEVVVHFAGRYIKGAAIKIRCHCCSQRCIVPEEVHAGHHSDMIIMFLHPPLSEQGVQQEYTVLHASQEAKDEPWCSCKTTHLH